MTAGTAAASGKPGLTLRGRQQLVRCFLNTAPMEVRLHLWRSGCVIDFVVPGRDDWLMIDVVDESHQAFLEFVF